MSKAPTPQDAADAAGQKQAQLELDEAFKEAANQVDEILGSFMQALLEKAGAAPGRGVEPEPLLTVPEVAAFCRVTEDTVRDWVKSGALRRVLGLRPIRIERDELKAFLARPAATPDKTKADALFARIRRQMELGADAGRSPVKGR